MKQSTEMTEACFQLLTCDYRVIRYALDDYPSLVCGRALLRIILSTIDRYFEQLDIVHLAGLPGGSYR